MKIFVANRVSEILETSEAKDWSHVPGDLNPADLLTRRVADPEKLMSSRWFNAPEFTEKDEECWPRLEIDHLDDGSVEIKRKPLFMGLNLVEVKTATSSNMGDTFR